MIAMLALAALPVSSALAAPNYGTVNGVTLNTQTGTATYGTAGSVTFSVTVTEGGNGSATTTLTAPGLPAGATASWSIAQPMNFNNSQNVTLTINTTVALAAGSYAFHVNSSDGSANSGNQNLVVSKANPVLSVTNSPVTYNGSPQAATVTASVPGSAISNVRYNASATVPTNAATYAITANFTPTDTANYNTLTSAAAGNFIINKANPVLTVTNTPVTYNGAPQAATVTASVPGSAISNVRYNTSLTVPTNAATYAITANFTPTDTTNYNTLVSASAGNFVINKATPTATLAVSNSPVTYDGSAKSATVSV